MGRESGSRRRGGKEKLETGVKADSWILKKTTFERFTVKKNRS